MRILIVALTLAAALALPACSGGDDVATPARSPATVAAPTFAVEDVDFNAEATRSAQELDELRRLDATRLAESVDSQIWGGAAPSGALEGGLQSAARDQLARTLSGEGREGPGVTSGDWTAWWYRPGHGDLTKAEVYATHAERGLFPVRGECVGTVAHPWREDQADMYHSLYEAAAELRPDWNLRWETFQASSRGRLAWELLAGEGLRLRVWVDFAVMERDGEAFYVLGAISDGESASVTGASGGEVWCPHWSELERSSVILVRLG